MEGAERPLNEEVWGLALVGHFAVNGVATAFAWFVVESVGQGVAYRLLRAGIPAVWLAVLVLIAALGRWRPGRPRTLALLGLAAAGFVLPFVLALLARAVGSPPYGGQ
jgi:hypothetical protein